MAEENVAPPPYEVYKGIKLYVTEDEQVFFDWYGRMQNVLEEEWEEPTLPNRLRATRNVIDMLRDLKEQGHVDAQGFVK